MMALGRFLVPPLVGAALLVVAGCGSGPTYPKATVAGSLEQLFKEEHLTTTVRFIDHTLAVHLNHPGTLTQSNGQIGIGPEFDDASRKLIMTIHRVILSTDAEIRFYVLLMSDPKVAGAYVTIVRYMDDVRRANALMLDTPEVFARTVFEMNFLGSNTLTIDQYVPRDIRLEEFLAWQLSRRLQHQLTEELQSDGVATVGRCGGTFENGEFAFTLDVAPAGGTTLDEATMQKIFLTSTNLIAKVLSSYHFDRFQSIRLIHPSTGRHLLLPKTRLEPFR